MAENINKRLIRYLNDAHATEEGGLASLRDVAAAATDPEARRLAEELAGVARTQIARLENRVRELGGRVETGKRAVNMALAKGSSLTNVFHDKADKQTQDITKAYSLSHFEVAMYTALASFARAAGDEETARLADTLVDEEREAGRRLENLIPTLAAAAIAQTTGSVSPASAHDGGGTMARLKVPALVLGGVALAVWGASRMR